MTLPWTETLGYFLMLPILSVIVRIWTPPRLQTFRF